MIRYKIPVLGAIFILCMFLQTGTVFAVSDIGFKGEGTFENPYLIQNYEDICRFRNLVNNGYSFEEEFFYQTGHIDMGNINWIPIGINGSFFMGNYDGGGHSLKNLQMTSAWEDDQALGVFGTLGGTVSNLGIESGIIDGYASGTIAGNAVGENAFILNCYNKASVWGYSVGGIANDFSGGTIVSSWNVGSVSGENAYGITALGGDVKLYGCFTTTPLIAPDDVVSTTSYALPGETIFSESFLLKLNIKVGIAQYLFANHADVTLMQWSLDSNGYFTYSIDDGWIYFWGLINYYLLPAVMVFVLLFYASAFLRAGKKNIWPLYQSRLKAFTIIFGILSYFMDTALISQKTANLNLGNLSFLFLCHFIFLVSLGFILKNCDWKHLRFQREWVPILLLIGITIVLELLQFSIVPKYDASLYYGSFVNGAKLFRLDLLTYIGAFVCWKWIQGLALLIASWEFLMPGQMVGVYLGNIVITVITLCCLFWLLRQTFKELSAVNAALGCAFFIFSPYALGLFTYLCMDWHLAFFAIWLIYSVKKKNHVLVAFCGYLLSFTKITGLVFYAFFLLAVAVLEIIDDRNNPFFQRIRNWWNIKKVFLWTFPAVMFLISFFFGDYFTIQNFYGTYVTDEMVRLKTGPSLFNTILQTFVFGFRWIILAGFLLFLISLLWKRKKPENIFTAEGRNLWIALAIASIGIFALLCVNNGDAECPRYTAIFNAFYAFAVPFLSIYFFKKERLKRLYLIVMTALVIIQTYYTIDPAIMLTTKSFYTGKINMYKLAVPWDQRPGMNLGIGYGPNIEVMSDLYTYNMEYAFYDDLLTQGLQAIAPTGEDPFYVLDIIDYELHISGSYSRNYKIYWNQRLQKRTYDKWDKDSIYLDVDSITTQELCSAELGNLWFADKLHLVVVDRVDEAAVTDRLKQEGYRLSAEIHPENTYGKMSFYTFEKESTFKE